MRRLLPLLALLALLVAPFGRMAAAEAMAMPHDSGMAAAGHCDDMPTHHQGNGEDEADRTIDCMTACAVMVSPDDDAAVSALPTPSAPMSLALRDFHGITPESDPPPPRFS